MSDGRTPADEGDPNTDPLRWFLLAGNRLAVAGVMLAGVGAGVLATGLLGIATVTTPGRVVWYLNGTVNGLLTLVPITVGVNQIVLSHEFGSIQDLYERRTDVSEFRDRVEDRTGVTVSSPRPAEFFETLLAGVIDTAEALRSERRGNDEPAEYADRVLREAERTREALSAASGMLEPLLVVLEYDDSAQYYETRKLFSEAETDASTDTAGNLDEIAELFAEIDAARQYLKTVVIERQLAELSRLLIYTAIPAVAVAALGIFTYRDVAGVDLSHPALVVVAGGLLTASLVPLAVPSAYILRVATIARQTAAFGPFVYDAELALGEDRDR